MSEDNAVSYGELDTPTLSSELAQLERIVKKLKHEKKGVRRLGRWERMEDITRQLWTLDRSISAMKKELQSRQMRMF